MKHLLAVSLGPVQSFIAAGRRPADLYAGSAILQRIAKAAAASLAASGARFIFPADLHKAAANKILVVIEGDPQKAAAAAERAAQKELESIWNEQMGKVVRALPIDEQRAYRQLESLLEFYSAWLPLADSYEQVRKDVDQLLSARKALRNFPQIDQGDAGIPKSPLNPAYAAVINPQDWQEAKARADGQEKPLRIKPSEPLDAISLLKRIYGVTELGSVPSTRVFARRAIEPNASNQDLPDDDEDLPESQPYFAILVADGDRMGYRIDQMDSEEKHREFSLRLAKFAEKAQEAVEAAGGYLVYAGGDDVLAFLPVTGAVETAEKLYDSFTELVGVVEEEAEEEKRASISIGIALVHYRNPLSMSLEAARAAEKLAKEERDSLAVALHTRAGSPLAVALSWEDARGEMSWGKMLELFNGARIPRGLPYELAELAQEWPSGLGTKRLQGEVRRVLRQKDVPEPYFVKLINVPEQLTTVAKQMTIARFLTAKGVRNNA